MHPGTTANFSDIPVMGLCRTQILEQDFLERIFIGALQMGKYGNSLKNRT